MQPTPEPYTPPWVIVSRKQLIPATPQLLWSLVTDSDYFNQLAGLSPQTTSLRQDKHGITVPHGTMSLFGIKLAVYSDPLIEWVHPRWFRREREIEKGPIIRLISRQMLRQEKKGTEIEYEIRFLPRRGFRWIARLIAMLTGRKMQRFLNIIEDEAGKGQLDDDIRLGTIKSDTDLPYLHEIVQRLDKYELNPVVVDTIRAWMIDEPDKNLRRIKPLQVARLLEHDPQDVIRFFLVATVEGLFDLRWDVICPNCKGVVAVHTDLIQVKQDFHCDVCQLDVTADFDDTIEVTFKPHFKVRRIDTAEFCYGYPAAIPHVLVQMTLEPGQVRVLEDAHEGRMDYWIAPHKHQGKINWGQKKNCQLLEIADDDVKISELELDFPLTILNGSKGKTVLQLQSTASNPDVLTASRLTSQQDFRDLFATQLLASDVNLTVRQLSFLFTDLIESTTLYNEMGDGPAFDLVKTHFDLAKELFRSHRGGTVKTVGDTIMAVFSHPDDAVRAAIKIREMVAEKGLKIKIGLHTGPCIAITQNDRLDYFGSMVNTAARVKSFCREDEMVITEDMYEIPGITEIVGGLNVESTKDTVESTGQKKPLRIIRLKFSPK